MKIFVAENSGFCFGVKKAINKTMEAINEQYKKIYTYGPLIHNKQETDRLSKLGVKSIDNLEEAKDSQVIIRSHGVPLRFYEDAKKYNVEIIDATCPFVRKVQKIAKKFYEEDYQIIIAGNPRHPEVIGINGWCNNSAFIVEDEKDVKKLPISKKICLVAQTTLTLEKWNLIINKLEEKTNELRAFNTICLATKERQKSCAETAKKVDLMIVIGGYHSSNTQKLYNISKKYCEKTIHIETAEELPLKDFHKFNAIGITAGASTPDWIINNVIKKLEDKGGDQDGKQ